MSGILGVWNSQKPTPWQKMLDDLLFLGRDGQGDWSDRNINLSLGRTQFYNTPESCHEAPVVEYKGCVLVWDGRLDDREALLVSDRSQNQNITDAHLIIESYRHWGVDCLRYLTGEFVFILWDASQDLLLVGCDVVGGRTIAYYWNGQTLLLSSRVLTLLLHPQVSQEFDQLYLAHTLCNLQAHPPGITPFVDIKRLQPGFALILKSGELQQRQIAKFTRSDRYESLQSPQFYHEKFWYLLNQAVKDRLRTHRPVCTTLSGGLDSTTVTVSLLNHLPTVDAFSTMTEVFPEFDERKPIESFLQRYPQVKSHQVNSDRAWSLTEPWERLPITDDPLITCTLPMNLDLMEQIQKQGFGIVFDGEGGDELFYTSLQDLARVNSWGQILQNLKGEKRWYSSLWRELAVPNLPQYWQKKWFARCQRKSNPLPPWITSTYAQKPQTQAALQEYFASSLSSDLMQVINWATTSGCAVGGNRVYKLLQSAYQLQYTSPLQDKRLIEFALNLHPSQQNHPVHGKIFLRQVNQTTLPDDVLWRPKRNYFDPVKYAAIGKGHQALELLEQLKDISFLEEIIDVKKVEMQLNIYRQGYSESYSPGKAYCNDMASWLYELFAFVNWYQLLKNRSK
jgi:asparagine synthase (glutamine-hydrolysing)